MITQFFLDGSFLFINYIASLIPFTYIPVSFIQVCAEVFNLVKSIGYFVPLGDLAVCVAMLGALWSYRFTMSLVMWVVRKVPLLAIE
jgi:hypothetical protein